MVKVKKKKIMKKILAFTTLVCILIGGFIYNSIQLGFWNTFGTYILGGFILYWLIKWIID